MSELEVRGDVFNPLETYGDYVELEVPRSELPVIFLIYGLFN